MPPNAFDSVNYSTNEPDRLVIGDRWMWKRDDLGVDYPPASYTLKYSLRLANSTATEIEITATGSGTDYLIEVPSATTALYTAGRYYWQLYITRNSDAQRLLLERGVVNLLTNQDAAATDPRTHARKVLDAIEAVLESRASKDQEEYSIAGRSLKRTPVEDLIVLRDKYKAEVAAEERAEKIRSGMSGGGRILVRM